MTEEKRVQFSLLWDGEDWYKDVTVSIDQGLIKSLEIGAEYDERHELVALPGMANLHSHAFQRGFAGLSEYRSAKNDSFWTWRKLMYQFVLRLSPEDVSVIAKQLYLEMLLAGYTWVGEFHYLHNDFDGSCYGNLAEMTEAVERAAREAGIGLCHLPVLYQRGGFQDDPLSLGQKRFELSAEQFIELVERSAVSAGNFRGGLALHSLRAVSAQVGREVVEHLQKSQGQIPVHIHVAEQLPEVVDCQAAHGMRPVEYLFDQYHVKEGWCLIHATHLVDREIEMIAKSKAVVGLCPTTEANLGDGFFSAKEFLKVQGRFGIGSDSHCSVDLRDELRTLEYGQRLRSNGRAILGTETESVGRRLYRESVRGGAQALGIGRGRIAVGERADLTLVDPQHPAIGNVEGDRVLDRLVFTNAGSPVAGVMVGGKMTLTTSSEFQAVFKQSSQAFNQVCIRLAGEL